MTGAYVAQAAAGPVLDETRAALGGLLGVPAEGVAFVQCATAALSTLLDVWPLSFGDRVAVLPSEWGPTRHMFEHRGYELVELAATSGGVLSMAGLERLLASPQRPSLVHLTQVASHRPLVQPVAAAAARCRAAGVPLWVDAAQALGHLDAACGADAVYGTSRKWLAGPRGVGMVGIAACWWDLLRISAPELELTVMPRDAGRVWLLQSFEAHVAGQIGLGSAVREFLDAGQDTVWHRLAAVGRLTRDALDGVPGWAVIPAAGGDVAITALRPVNGQDVFATRARLIDEHGIVATACSTARAPLDMTEPLLRVSPHVDCTEEDLDKLGKALTAGK